MTEQIFNFKALVIGLDNVKPNLKEIKNNLDAVIDTLKIMKIPEDDIKVLYNSTKQEIQSQLEDIKKKAEHADKTGEPFQYWIYYAGHGEIRANSRSPTV